MNTEEILQDVSEVPSIYSADLQDTSTENTESMVYVERSLTSQESMAQGIWVIVLVVVVWFSMWVMRSWRTWSVKGGK